MLHRLPRAAVAGLATAAALGGAVLLAPAANAMPAPTGDATTTPSAATTSTEQPVTTGDTAFSATRTAGTETVTLTFTALTTDAVEVDHENGGVWLAKQYQVTATDGSTTLFDRKESGWHVALTVEALDLKATFPSEQRLTHDLRRLARAGRGEAERATLYAERQLAVQAVATTMLTNEQTTVATWIAANPTATDFAGLTGGKTTENNGFRVHVSGTPAAYEIRVRHEHGVHVATTWSSTTKATTTSRNWLTEAGTPIIAL